MEAGRRTRGRKRKVGPLAGAGNAVERPPQKRVPVDSVGSANDGPRRRSGGPQNGALRRDEETQHGVGPGDGSLRRRGDDRSAMEGARPRGSAAGKRPRETGRGTFGGGGKTGFGADGPMGEAGGNFVEPRRAAVGMESAEKVPCEGRRGRGSDERAIAEAGRTMAATHGDDLGGRPEDGPCVSVGGRGAGLPCGARKRNVGAVAERVEGTFRAGKDVGNEPRGGGAGELVRRAGGGAGEGRVGTGEREQRNVRVADREPETMALGRIGAERVEPGRTERRGGVRRRHAAHDLVKRKVERKDERFVRTDRPAVAAAEIGGAEGAERERNVGQRFRRGEQAAVERPGEKKRLERGAGGTRGKTRVDLPGGVAEIIAGAGHGAHRTVGRIENDRRAFRTEGGGSARDGPLGEGLHGGIERGCDLVRAFGDERAARPIAKMGGAERAAAAASSCSGVANPRAAMRPST